MLSTLKVYSAEIHISNLNVKARNTGEYVKSVLNDATLPFALMSVTLTKIHTHQR